MKNNNIKIKNCSPVKIMLASIIICVVFFASCSALGGFSRSTAAAAIEKDKRYSSAATMTINIRARLTNASPDIYQLSAEETAEAASVRSRADFMQRHPQIIVAEELGFIKLKFENPEIVSAQVGQKNYRTDLGIWTYKLSAELTDKGKALWKDLDLAEDAELLPLATRQAPEITGMKDERSAMKSVDFTYKWEPNALGRAFDPSSNEFKQLSPNLQEALGTTQYNMFGGGSNNTVNFKATRSGKAYFQKFDDGWRIANLMF